MPILKTMQESAPELVLMLGDNIYADTEDMELMRAKYKKLGQNEHFAALREQCPMLATWDDHDYGVNDGGAEYPMREEAQQIFADFWKLPTGSPVRSRPGVYDAHIFGPPGKRVQVLLLDTRSFRSALLTGERRVGGPYYPDDDSTKTMLGETQWMWLEEQLLKPAEVRIIATGIQCLAEAAGQETWSNLPLERQRLFDLITKTNANGVLIVSGDRHWAEFSKVTSGVPYPIHDFTASSFNQSHPRGTPTENRYRSLPTTYHIENFGNLDINWDLSPVRLIIEIRDIKNKTQLQQFISLDDLSVKTD